MLFHKLNCVVVKTILEKGKKITKPKRKNNDSKWGKIADLLETWQKEDVKEKN